MQGTRLPDATMGEPGAGWDAWEAIIDGTRTVIAPPGAYMKVRTRPEKAEEIWCWYVRSPTGDVNSIGFATHSVEEHEDGTISVSPSIVFTHGTRWHGFLRRGVWS